MFNRFITSPASMVTTHEQTRTAFMQIALEKNRVGDPYVKEAYAFKAMTAGVARPEDLLSMPQVRSFLITAAGLSDKSLAYLNESDRTYAIQELIDKYLKSAGSSFVDEAVYRFLLTRGDTVGGIMRNRIGTLGQEKLIRAILSCMNLCGMEYDWLDNSKKPAWKHRTENDPEIERSMKALHWENENGHRVLGFNLKVPVVNKNVDLCLFSCDKDAFRGGKIASSASAALMLGELKGGMDPAGADEHWKTANTALERIRSSYRSVGTTVKTSFVGAAIENAMAGEIYHQLVSQTMDNAANLCDNDQLVEYCSWLIHL